MRKALELGLPWGDSFNHSKNEESDTEDEHESQNGKEEDDNDSNKENMN